MILGLGPGSEGSSGLDVVRGATAGSPWCDPATINDGGERDGVGMSSQS